MSHIIDADKLLEFVEAGMRHSKFCAQAEPVTQNGEHDVVSSKNIIVSSLYPPY